MVPEGLLLNGSIDSDRWHPRKIQNSEKERHVRDSLCHRVLDYNVGEYFKITVVQLTHLACFHHYWMLPFLRNCWEILLLSSVKSGLWTVSYVGNKLWFAFTVKSLTWLVLEEDKYCMGNPEQCVTLPFTRIISQTHAYWNFCLGLLHSKSAQCPRGN